MHLISLIYIYRCTSIQSMIAYFKCNGCKDNHFKCFKNLHNHFEMIYLVRKALYILFISLCSLFTNAVKFVNKKCIFTLLKLNQILILQALGTLKVLYVFVCSYLGLCALKRNSGNLPQLKRNAWL